MSIIKFDQKPEIPEYPVGHEDYGYIWIRKIFDWTPPEKEWIEARYKEAGIIDRMDATVLFAEELVERHNESSEVLDFAVYDQLATRVLALDADDEEFAFRLFELKKLAEEAKKGKPKLDSEYAVKRILREDPEFMADHYLPIAQFGKDFQKVSEKKDQILACAMLKFRYAPDPTTFDMEQFETERREGTLPYMLIEALSDFAEGERTHWRQQKASDLQTQLDLKKKLLELRKQKEKGAAKNLTKSTGKPTSGN